MPSRCCRCHRTRPCLHLISGLALGRCPGRETAAAEALHRALSAGPALGDVLGTAYAVEALAWLAAWRARPSAPRCCSALAVMLREPPATGP
ncbi:MAG TPA: hypothetical protein VF838_05340 [Trebonia sp.]